MIDNKDIQDRVNKMFSFQSTKNACDYILDVLEAECVSLAISGEFTYDNVVKEINLLREQVKK